MYVSALQHGVFGTVAAVVLAWAGLLPLDFLLDLGRFVLIWGLASTLLVASAAAWVAYGRARRAASRR